ncbi:STAS domain-containing protein [Parabacteroides sp. OttesenSCG-928-N08]|nr:STAS domain-containing protein [Parabacteroides sp. OttesenSCG-928-N08]
MIEIKQKKSETVISLCGRIDTSYAAIFEEKVAPLKQGSMKNIVIDCSRLVYISSSGFRVFLGLKKAAGQEAIRVRDVSRWVKGVFDVTGFTDLFEFEYTHHAKKMVELTPSSPDNAHELLLERLKGMNFDSLKPEV